MENRVHLPPQLRHLPRVDGLPVPAHTDSEMKKFATQSVARSRLLAITRRCVICAARIAGFHAGVATFSDDEIQPDHTVAPVQIACPDGTMHLVCLLSAFKLCPALPDEDWVLREEATLDDDQKVTGKRRGATYIALAETASHVIEGPTIAAVLQPPVELHRIGQDTYTGLVDPRYDEPAPQVDKLARMIARVDEYDLVLAALILDSVLPRGGRSKTIARLVSHLEAEPHQVHLGEFYNDLSHSVVVAGRLDEDFMAHLTDHDRVLLFD